VFELLGVAGIAISMLAYLPQVVHLAKEHCSAAAAILVLGHRYRGLVCEAHLHSIPERWLGTEP
jgi:L-serine deaminase